jgi:cysteine-S-conjugate beta-lyase
MEPILGTTLDELRQRTSVKWRAYEPDVLPLWVAEMDVRPCPSVVDAVTTAVRAGDTGYPAEIDAASASTSGEGTSAGTSYVDALAGFARRRWQWDLPVERTMLVPDVMIGVAEVLRVLTDAGDAVVVNPPVYPPFYGFIDLIERRTVEAPLGPDHRLDLDALGTAFSTAREGDRRAAYLLCNPHNPTGTVHTAEELAAVAELARQHGVRVVVDEIHAPLVYDEASHTPYLSVPGGEDGIALFSASKGWNLAGLKAGVAVAGVGALQDLRGVSEMVTHGASHLGVIAHIAAFTEGEAWLDGLLGELDSNRHLLAGLLAEKLPEVGYRVPQATYLAWLDCRALGLGDDPSAAFLERGRVALNSGPEFGTGGAGHVRLNLATSPEILTEAVDRMAASV